MQLLIWISLVSMVSAWPLASILPRQTACKAVHIIVARGSTEAQGEGVAGSVATKIKARVANSDSEAVVYPATLDNYVSSESQGTAAMTKAIKAYVDRCPNAKIVILGYSQGGQVAMDTICGTSENNFPSTSPLPSKYAARVYAVVPFGEPSHMINQVYDAGTSTRNGIFPRNNLAGCQPFASKIKSYCDANDQFCDSGNSLQVHGAYFDKYGTDAANFAVAKVS